MGAKLIDKIDTIVRASNLNVQNMTSQLMGDLFTIEMQAAGVPRKKIMEINAAVADSYVEYNKLWNKDREGDKELTYSVEVLDRALRQACGDVIPFADFYERYDGLLDITTKKEKKK